MICRVHHDGTHYVACVPGKRPYANWGRRPKNAHELAFRSLYKATKVGSFKDSEEGRVFEQGLSGEEHKQFIRNVLLAENRWKNKCFSNFSDSITVNIPS